MIDCRIYFCIVDNSVDFYFNNADCTLYITINVDYFNADVRVNKLNTISLYLECMCDSVRDVRVSKLNTISLC